METCPTGIVPIYLRAHEVIMAGPDVMQKTQDNQVFHVLLQRGVIHWHLTSQVRSTIALKLLKLVDVLNLSGEYQQSLLMSVAGDTLVYQISPTGTTS